MCSQAEWQILHIECETSQREIVEESHLHSLSEHHHFEFSQGLPKRGAEAWDFGEITHLRSDRPYMCTGEGISCTKRT